jgi:hypothetical protein
VVVGQRIVVRVHKASYGRSQFKIEYDLINNPTSSNEPVLNFYDSTARWFAEEGFYGTVVANGRYSCELLGVQGVTAEAFHKAFHANEELKQDLGDKLRISGYWNPVAEAAFQA